MCTSFVVLFLRTRFPQPFVQSAAMRFATVRVSYSCQILNCTEPLGLRNESTSFENNETGSEIWLSVPSFIWELFEKIGSGWGGGIGWRRTVDKVTLRCGVRHCLRWWMTMMMMMMMMTQQNVYCSLKKPDNYTVRGVVTMCCLYLVSCRSSEVDAGLRHRDRIFVVRR